MNQAINGNGTETGISQHNLDKVLATVQTTVQQRKYRKVVPLIEETAAEKERVKRMMITTDFSLVGIQSKIDVMKATPLCTDLMVFLNRKGSLAHIMSQIDVQDPDFHGRFVPYIRMPIPTGLVGAHPDFILRWLFKKLVTRYNI